VERGPGALAGVRVLDMTRFVAGPVAGQTLADLGADVIKVEKPRGGDDARFAGLPALRDGEGAEIRGLSSYYLSCNRNKRSVTVDHSTPAGQQIIRGLVQWADVVIENFKVGVLARYGLDYATLSRLKPELVYCSITGYGQTGPLAEQPGFDSAFQARSGMMSVTGEAGGEPQRVGVHVVDYIAGQNAVIAILAALRHLRERGRGQHIDISLLDAALATMTTAAQRYLMSGEVQARIGNRTPGSVVSRLFACQDGPISVSASSDEDFKRFCRAIGAPDLADDPRFATRAGRFDLEAQIDALLEPILAQETVADWTARLQAAGIVCAPVYAMDQALADPQAVARGMVVRVDHPRAGSLGLLGSPIRMSETPVDRYTAPPALGEHTEAVLTEILGMSPERIAELKKTREV
jgi:crotonobetainyl-CoA:carnitine CoA-transferase CaiB-like acyl-CoA transferase